MARVKRAVHGRKHRRAVLEQARGYYGNKSRSFKSANEQVMHSLQYAYRDRRARKGDFRQLWIQRINAPTRPPLRNSKQRRASGSNDRHSSWSGRTLLSNVRLFRVWRDAA